MYCNNCAGDTDIGHVIHPRMDGECRMTIAPTQVSVDNETMRVIYCVKCKNCGHSEYLYKNDMHDGGTKVELTNHSK